VPSGAAPPPAGVYELKWVVTAGTLIKEFPFKITVIDCARPLIHMGNVGVTAFTYIIDPASIILEIPVPTYMVTDGSGC
jgi:hypothetical protein